MDIKPTERSIRELLSAQKQYVIPRFQREYSWDKRNYNEFLLDMLGNLKVEKGQIGPTSYFMGTMLFVGDAEDKTQRQSQVVDGQQRLTTITILFSVLSNLFSDSYENKLAENVFRYIMAEDDNGQEVRVLKTVTSYPYFSYYVQKRDKTDAKQPASEEERSIEETYSFFYKQLQEVPLRANLKKLGIDVTTVPYVEILKALRDQVLSSTIIEIYTSDNSVANKLFEILNAKGKHLSFIDLVKNKIFGHEKEIEPADFASETWSEITKLINTGEERTGLATFFRQYWVSKYKSSTASTLYKDFERIVKEEEYKSLLKDLRNEAVVYQRISNPSREAFENRKQYFFLVQILRNFNTYFNVIQVRVPLLALFYAKERGLIRLKKLETVASYLEGFHFAYNSVLSKSPNRIEPIYSKFSIALRQCDNAEDAERIIREKLLSQLDLLFPKFDEFCEEFIKVSYTKQDNPLNLKAKYILNRIHSYYQEENLFDEKGSIEHIVPEGDEKTTNIGNLILLERELNNQAGDEPFENKVKVYNLSNYRWVKEFINEHKAWDITQAESRAKLMAKIFYENVLARG